MSDIAIKIENLSKQYRLGVVGTGTLSHDLKRWWAVSVRGKEDPYLKIGEANIQDRKGTSEYIWALRDINLEVKEGEVLGIIGKNGAGKSTLLKILSRVTRPTSGNISYKGRIASLLEVGTGFHPEMTGRENIFMNGSIMGMTNAEIKRKFDEIVDFAGVERYIDTPVKRYSSGMTVRLGFAIAAHLEPEILVVDEVLAVGDAEFQKKAIGKMQDVSQGKGRTVLFVSHNMAAVKSLCIKGIVLKDGYISYKGEVANSVNYYLSGTRETQNRVVFNDEHDRDRFILHEISVNPKGLTSDNNLDEYHEIELKTKITVKDDLQDLHLTYVLKNESGEPLFTLSHAQVKHEKKLKKGLSHLTCTFPKGFLNVGSYYLSLYIIQNSKHTIFMETDIISFHVQEGSRELGSWMGREPGFIKPNFPWTILNGLTNKSE